MKLYGQRDARWKDKKLGNSNSSIGDYGCCITCLSMLADITPDEFNTRFTAVNGYQVDLVLWSKIKEAVPWLEFEWRGYQYDNDKVKKAITDYGGCLVEVDFDGSIATPRDRHWVLYIGNGRMWDPWTNRECATSKYPRVTGYSIIRVYTKPVNQDTSTLPDIEGLNNIVKFIQENKITEGQLREGFAYVKEQTVPKLEKKVKDLETSQKDLEARLAELEAKVSESEENSQNWQSRYETANKSLEKKIKEFDVIDNERKQWKSRYESKCLETADKLNSWELFKLLIKKLSWKK